MPKDIKATIPNPKPPRPPRQFTLEPGDGGSPHGPAHTTPLVKDSPAQKRYGPGTYGNDQFAAEHHDDISDDPTLPEGLQDRQSEVKRPTLRPKEKRYGRIGGDGEG